MSRFPTAKEKFEKAVNVIRNLPKNGSFQPSYELQLKFYAYYKQATEGPNHSPKPSFWEVVKRAKWDAWEKLGNMTKEEAMTHYVEELRKIVETMSYTDNVANFLNSLDNFYEHVPAEDLEILIGPIIDRVRSRPDSPLSGSPLASRDTSPSRATAISRDESPLRLTANNVHAQKHITSSLETSPASSYSASPLPPDTEEEEEEDHFLDTQMEPDRGLLQKIRMDGANTAGHQDQVKDLSAPYLSSVHKDKQPTSKLLNTNLSPPENAQNFVDTIKKNIDQLHSRMVSLENKVSKQSNPLNSTLSELTNASSSGVCPEFSVTIKNTVEKMTKDMETLQRRIATLEGRRQEVTLNRKKSGVAHWGLSLQTTAVLFAWPIVIMLIAKFVSNRRQK